MARALKFSPGHGLRLDEGAAGSTIPPPAVGLGGAGNQLSAYTRQREGPRSGSRPKGLVSAVFSQGFPTHRKVRRWLGTGMY